MNPNKFVPTVLQMVFFFVFALIARFEVENHNYDSAVMWGLFALPYAVAIGIAFGRESKR